MDSSFGPKSRWGKNFQNILSIGKLNTVSFNVLYTWFRPMCVFRPGWIHFIKLNTFVFLKCQANFLGSCRCDRSRKKQCIPNQTFTGALNMSLRYFSFGIKVLQWFRPKNPEQHVFYQLREARSFSSNQDQRTLGNFRQFYAHFNFHDCNARINWSIRASVIYEVNKRPSHMLSTTLETNTFAVLIKSLLEINSSQSSG